MYRPADVNSNPYKFCGRQDPHHISTHAGTHIHAHLGFEQVLFVKKFTNLQWETTSEEEPQGNAYCVPYEFTRCKYLQSRTIPSKIYSSLVRQGHVIVNSAYLEPAMQ